jgi:hypothetical protein
MITNEEMIYNNYLAASLELTFYHLIQKVSVFKSTSFLNRFINLIIFLKAWFKNSKNLGLPLLKKANRFLFQ